MGVHLANILRDRDPQRALSVYNLVIGRLTEIRNNVGGRRTLASALANSSYALRTLRQTGLAKQRIDQSLAILKDTKDYPAKQIPLGQLALLDGFRALADYEAPQGDPLHAVQLYQELLERVMAARPDPLNDLRDAPPISLLYQALANLYRRTGKVREAEVIESRRLALWEAWNRKLPNNAFILHQLEAVRLP